MTDDSPEESHDAGDGIDPATVEQFLADADSALAEYDRGYADADATLQVLRRHLDALRDATEESPNR